MTVTKKLIGRLPILLGEYDSTKTYSKRQRVTLYGSEFESKIDNNTIAPAILNNNTIVINTNNWQIVSNGTDAFLATDKINNIESRIPTVVDNPEFITAITDSEGKLLGGYKTDGNYFFAAGIPKQIQDALQSLLNNIKNELNGIRITIDTKVNKENGKVLVDANIANSASIIDDIEERTEIKLDKDNKVISYRDKNGTLHESSIEVGSLRAANVITKVDFSEYLSNNGDFPLHLPEPYRAYINFITNDGRDRLGVIDNQKAVIEFWDGYGNYFRKNCLLSRQGNSSQSQWKRNISLDLFDTEINGDAFSVKFGDWVAQDSYHLKAYYEDITRGINVVNYKFGNMIDLTRGIQKDRPYKDYFNVNTDVTDPIANNSGTTDHSIDLKNDARTISDGFPAIVYLNGEFYGVFAMQLKKHRDNFNMDRNAVDNIHLDGELGYDEFWGGVINWSVFEIRNPKPKSKKWTLLCQDGSKYNGDSPKEIMGKDSSSYNADDTSCVKSAALKDNIIAVSKYMAEIKVYEDTYNANKTDENLSALKTEIEKRFGIKYLIDYVLQSTVDGDPDSMRKNCQWVTWGKNTEKIKMYPRIWDKDMTFGIDSTHGFKIGAPSATKQGANSKTPFRYVWDYYLSDLELRYKELRDSGIISVKTFENLIMNWVHRVGQSNYQLEYDKWNESPCHRDNGISDKWTCTWYNAITYWDGNDDYNKSTTYTKDSYAKVNHILYKSLQDNNKNHSVYETDWWKQVSYQDGITYTKGTKIYDGYNTFYEFTAKEDTTERPFKKLYKHYPCEGGTYDSPMRICAWIEKKITLIDNLLNYK